jgi:hypothetical protein
MVISEWRADCDDDGDDGGKHLGGETPRHDDLLRNGGTTPLAKGAWRTLRCDTAVQDRGPSHRPRSLAPM